MGMFSDISGPILKSSPLKRQIDKHDRKLARRAAKEAADAKAEREAAKVRAEVWDRDKGIDRAYGVPVFRAHENPALVGHSHHIVFRSHGGEDTTANEVLLSPIAHERAHARYDAVVLEIHGNADDTLTFVEKQIETGKELRRWESPVPVTGTADALKVERL